MPARTVRVKSRPFYHLLVDQNININLHRKQKNMISYQRYVSKKRREPDYLCNAINRFKHLSKVEEAQSDPELSQKARRILQEKRIEQIKKQHKSSKVSSPEPYIKRTWVSPLVAIQKQEDSLGGLWKKSVRDPLLSLNENKEKAENVCKILNLNKKMHLFGEFLWSDFEQKQNLRVTKLRGKGKQMDALYIQFNRLINGIKKSIVVCNKDSSWNERLFVNPLQDDKYYQKIIKQSDQELTKLLIETLSASGNFTFSAFIQFYEIFVWQQASKETQIEFVLKLLMSQANSIPYCSLSYKIDILCSKIYLTHQKDILSGFNEVMKKLMFGVRYDDRDSSQLMTREEVRDSLLVNQECISIFVNIFYTE